jgi:hypothetical protein
VSPDDDLLGGLSLLGQDKVLDVLELIDCDVSGRCALALEQGFDCIQSLLVLTRHRSEFFFDLFGRGNLDAGILSATWYNDYKENQRS